MYNAVVNTKAFLMTTITINTVDYFSLASRAEATEFLQADFTHAAAWGSATDGTKDSALVTATRCLQSISWNEDTQGYVDGTATPVPSWLINAAALLAAGYVGGTFSGRPDRAQSSVKRAKEADAEVEMFSSASGSSKGWLPPEVLALIFPYLEDLTTALPKASSLSLYPPKTYDKGLPFSDTVDSEV